MPENIGLVLSGGGARGAYEIGVLSVLLPWLEQRHNQRPDVLVGTSIGAINVGYLAAGAQKDTATLLRDAGQQWLKIDYDRVMGRLFALRELRTINRLLLSVLQPRVVPRSLLDSRALVKALRELVPSAAQIHNNVIDPKVGLTACAVVATAAHTNRSVVFHDGGRKARSDDRRGIDYVATSVEREHIEASAAIPVVFPAVRVDGPGEGWYFDGGTRLNTPIKPALRLGAKRVIVIGLNSVSPAPPSATRPDLFDGASQVVQGLLVDPLLNDVTTLAGINEAVLRAHKAGSGGEKRALVPYIFVAPKPNEIGEIAQCVYEQCFAGVGALRHSLELSLLGRLIGAGSNSTRGELLSYFFFAKEFAARLLQLGREHAMDWTKRGHDDGAWQLKRLPAAKGARR